MFTRYAGFSKFFGPSPRKHRLTVYRGLQVLRMLLSDLYAPLKEPSLGIKVRCCMRAMLVIIMRAEISCREDLGDVMRMLDFMIRSH